MTQTDHTPTLGTRTKNICLSMNVRRRIPTRRTLVVLGVERGGTSMAAGVLRAIGVPMGPTAGLNHEDPLFLRDDPEKLQNAVRTRNKEHQMWGFKVPKASLQLPFWERTLRNPFYVVVYRNSMSIVDSWQQRGARGGPVAVLDRISQYQNAILDMAKKTSAPILFVNYERAVADEASKRATIRDCAAFAGIELDQTLEDRAVAMMTGDGKGYVNLPEHHFLVRPAAPDGPRAAMPLREGNPDHRDAKGWVRHDNHKPLITYALETGDNLPKRFWLELDFASKGLRLGADPLRIFFNFTGNYFTGHCARPTVSQGRNMYWVETSGNAADFGFGPISMPSKLNITARAYAATAADTPPEGAGHGA
ncbi:MAG: hypothetical protein AAFP16_02325 [Pseudomonadota bacterium]